MEIQKPSSVNETVVKSGGEVGQGILTFHPSSKDGDIGWLLNAGNLGEGEWGGRNLPAKQVQEKGALVRNTTMRRRERVMKKKGCGGERMVDVTPPSVRGHTRL